RLVRPVAFVYRALGDPAFDRLLLPRGENLVSLFRRHRLVFVVREDAPVDLALFWLAGNDRDYARFRLLSRLFANVQAQSGLASILVRAVATVTGVGKNRADITIVADRRLVRRSFAIQVICDRHQRDADQNPRFDSLCFAKSEHATLVQQEPRIFTDATDRD